MKYGCIIVLCIFFWTANCEFVINGVQVLNQSSVATATLSDGTVITTFITPTYAIQAQKFFQDGTLSGNAFQVNSAATEVGSVDLACISSKYFVVYSKLQSGNLDIFSKTLDNQGVSGGEQQVNAITVGNQTLPIVREVPSTSTLAMIWLSDNSTWTTIQARYFLYNTSTFSSEFTVANSSNGVVNYPSSAPILYYGQWSVLVVWQQQQNSPNGTDIFGAVCYLDSTCDNPFVLVSQSGNQTRPKVSRISTGDLALVWENSDGNIYLSLFDQSLVIKNNIKNILVNTYTTGSQVAPTIATLTSNFLVLWQSFGQDESSLSSIYAQLFNASGSKYGTEFRVSDTLGNNDYGVTASGTSQDQFFAAWNANSGELHCNAKATILSASNTAALRYFTEDTTYSFSSLPITVNLPAFASTVNVTLKLPLSSGNLTVPSINSTTSSFTPATGIWTVQGPVADVNWILQSIAYIPKQDFNQNFNITVTIRENTNTTTINDITLMNGTQVNDPPMITANQWSVIEGSSNALTTSNLNATDVDSPTSQLVFFVVSSTNGFFALNSNISAPVTSFNHTQVLTNQVYFVQDGSESSPYVSLVVSDGQANSTISISSVTFTPVNDPPTLVNNSLIIQEGANVTITSVNLAATDPDTLDSNITFTVLNVTFGGFWKNGVPVSSFTQQDISNGLIIFSHNGSESAPSYFVHVTDGINTTSPSPAFITFTNVNDPPVLVNYTITVTEGQSVVLTTLNLYAVDPDSSPSQIRFFITNLTNGVFLRDSSAVNSFSLASVMSGIMNFTHFGENIPSFAIFVTDGVNSTMPVPGIVNFTPVNDIPVITVNTLTISEGGTVTLSAANLNVNDPDATNASLVFTVQNVTAGNFTKNGVVATNFTMEDILAKVVNFTHDGNEIPPSYRVRVTDGIDTTSFLPATINYTSINDPPVFTRNMLNITEGGKVIFTQANNLAVYDPEVALGLQNLTFVPFLVNYGTFSMNSFTPADIQAGVVYLQHDYSENPPTYQIRVTDGTDPVTSAASVTYTPVNDAPVASLAAITIRVNQTVILNLQVIDPDGPLTPLLINATNLYACFFQLNHSRGVHIDSFTYLDVINKIVELVQDGSQNTPNFLLLVSDGLVTTSVASAVILDNSTETTTESSTTGPSSTNPSTTGSESSASEESNDNTALIAGVVGGVGGAVVLSVASLTIVTAMRRKIKSRTPAASEVEMNGSESPRTAYTEAPVIKRKHSTEHDFKWEINYTELVVKEELGRGAFGVVYRAMWRNSECVVKQLDMEKTNSSVQEFLKEANMVKKLRQHPNVCTVYGVCTAPFYPICIIMEYLPGGSLLEYMASGRIEIDIITAVELFKDISSGMSHIHQENLLHCDLAARNLLVAPRADGKIIVKVADFGLSKRTESGIYSLHNRAKFPIRWTAPEIFQSSKLSKASDVWSFGVVMWEILELKVPYFEMDNQEVVSAVCDLGYRLPKPARVACPDDVYHIMQSCWNSDPKKRPSFNDLFNMFSHLEQEFGEARSPDNSSIRKLSLLAPGSPVGLYSDTSLATQQQHSSHTTHSSQTGAAFSSNSNHSQTSSDHPVYGNESLVQEPIPVTPEIITAIQDLNSVNNN